jgi:hypothetical protein
VRRSPAARNASRRDAFAAARFTLPHGRRLRARACARARARAPRHAVTSGSLRTRTLFGSTVTIAPSLASRTPVPRLADSPV